MTSTLQIQLKSVCPELACVDAIRQRLNDALRGKQDVVEMVLARLPQFA
jgi:hypothetical protein